MPTILPSDDAQARALVAPLFGMLREARRLLKERWAQAPQRSPAPEREYLAYLGALAAGALHEIRSPLCTMAVVIKELLQQEHDHAAVRQNLKVMAEQIETCRRILAQAVKHGTEDSVTGPADEMLEAALARLKTLRPDAKVACRCSGTQPPPRIRMTAGLDQALINLINNALDACPGEVELSCSWSARELRILVLDRGPGYPAGLIESLGERPITTKGGGGMGLGLLLACTAAQRAGGTLTLSNRAGGGARAEIVVPAC